MTDIGLWCTQSCAISCLVIRLIALFDHLTRSAWSRTRRWHTAQRSHAVQWFHHVRVVSRIIKPDQFAASASVFGWISDVNSIVNRITSTMIYLSSPTTIFVSVSVCLAAAESNTTYPQAKPALAVNFPDPALVSVDGMWLAFATAGNGRNVQVAASASFSEHSWRLLEDVDVLPDPGPWAANDRNIWAPHVYGLVSA